jgi:type III secretion protein U
MQYFEQRRASEGAVAWALEYSMKTLLQVVLPIMLVTLAAGLLGAFVQVRALFSLEPIKPKMERLNPALGLKRMFLMRNLIDFAKMTIKIALLGILVYVLLRSFIDEAPYAIRLSPAAIAALGVSTLGKLMGWTAVIYAAMAAVDYAHQGFEFMQQQRMSREELRREAREDEGEPLLKSRRRLLARELAMQDLDHEVRGASVIIAGARSAVALHYQSDAKTLPRVVAKGWDATAVRIQELARQAGVPVHRDDALAQRLFRASPAGEFIASELFEPIARVLSTLGRHSSR